VTSTTASGPDRLGLVPAPGGLTLVQELLNSAGLPSLGVPDLLTDADAAAGWLDAALTLWSRQTGSDRPALSVRAADLADLRTARAALKAWLAGGEAVLPPTTVVLRAGGGRVVLGPTDGGVQGLLGLVMGELLLAQRDGTLPRLKTCANPACGMAFYDLSRNSSRVWHDVRTCGNVTNLRASRARRRAADQT
jgi:predicted RNA-binding Zn ribbon-like protein